MWFCSVYNVHTLQLGMVFPKIQILGDWDFDRPDDDAIDCRRNAKWARYYHFGMIIIGNHCCIKSWKVNFIVEHLHNGIKFRKWKGIIETTFRKGSCEKRILMSVASHSWGSQTENKINREVFIPPFDLNPWLNMSASLVVVRDTFTSTLVATS